MKNMDNITVYTAGLNELARQFHERAKAKGFWDEKRETGTLLMLIVSELSEALEADRRNRYARFTDYVQGYSNHYDPEQKKGGFELHIKDSFEDEIADVMIRLFDFIGERGIDIEKYISLKMEYNATRPYKHGKAY